MSSGSPCPPELSHITLVWVGTPVLAPSNIYTHKYKIHSIVKDLKETLSQVDACGKYIFILVAFLEGIKFVDHIFSSTQFYGH